MSEQKEQTTQISVIVSYENDTQKPGGKMHKLVMDHFSSPRFHEYAAFRELDESLLQDISGELTRYLRQANNRAVCDFSNIVAAICTDAKGYPMSDGSGNVIVFSIEIRDGD